MNRRLALLCTVFIVCALLTTGGSDGVRAESPEWLEPRALNIVDLAGQVPDEILEGAILASSDAGGVALFQSSEAEGRLLHIRVHLRGRRLRAGEGVLTRVTLLGQRPAYDHAYSATSSSWVRLYEGDREITGRVLWCHYVAPELRTPEADSSQWVRYPSLARLTYDLPLEEHGLRLLANMGGELTLLGEYTNLEAVFTYVLPEAVRVQVLGTQETTFRSYIGPVANAGLLSPVADEMYARYREVRHDRIPLEIPAYANYVLFVYPPGDYWVHDVSGYNVQTPYAGAVRLATEDGLVSQEFTHSGAFPLRAVWQEAEQCLGPDYLSLLPPVDWVISPEFVVPPGTPHDDCFLEGGCSDAVLDAIYDAETPLRIVYLHAEPATRDVRVVPLRFMDDPTLPAAPAVGPERPCSLYVPLLLHPVHIPVPDALPRPVGFFVEDGRMIGYLP